MKKIIVSAFAVAALAIPAVASADDGGGAYGKTWQDATGCTYGDIVRLVKANPNHPSINGLVPRTVWPLPGTPSLRDTPFRPVADPYQREGRESGRAASGLLRDYKT